MNMRMRTTIALLAAILALGDTMSRTEAETVTREIPAIDRAAPAEVQTATFGLG